jgi:hypothetical protein
MHVLINHCWCSDSNWGGHYDCRVIVGINRIEKDKTFYDPPSADWTLLTERIKDWDFDEIGIPKDTIRLKPEVLQWLTEEVGGKKWAVGSDAYNSRDTLNVSVFFQSSRDAMRFIKRWSVFGKPVSYLNYFTENRRELDLKTGRLKRVTRN